MTNAEPDIGKMVCDAIGCKTPTAHWHLEGEVAYRHAYQQGLAAERVEGLILGLREGQMYVGEVEEKLSARLAELEAAQQKETPDA